MKGYVRDGELRNTYSQWRFTKKEKALIVECAEKLHTTQVEVLLLGLLEIKKKIDNGERIERD